MILNNFNQMHLFKKQPNPLTGTKLAIIGAGAVGSTIAYTAVVKNLASCILLIDANQDKEIGEIMDIGNGLAFTETARVQTAEARQAADADIIVLTAGAKQAPGQTRLDLTAVNQTITRQIFQDIGKIMAASHGAANPVNTAKLLEEMLK